MDSPSPANNSGSVDPMVRVYMALTALVLLLMMVLGLLMRATQSQWLPISPLLFYQIMTAHGIGMVSIVGFGGTAIMWHFLGQHVRLNGWVLKANLGLFLLGVVFVLVGIFAGGFAGGWTFLHPLPSKSMGVWKPWGAASFLMGVLIVGTGLLLYYLETGRAILARWGSVPAALGWGVWRGSKDLPSPTVVAATVVTVVNLLSVLAGAVILALMLINLYAPQFTIDALLAKNMIFFFGHVFINTAIYMSVIAVYELLPRFSGRPWKLSGPFVAAWTATLLMVLAVYPHHTLMDFAMPVWANVMGQILSYTSALPVLAVTLIGTCSVIYRSGMRWSVVPALLFLSVFGWSAGVIPAVIDGTIAINRVMHNTLWVPGHFHFYLLLGVVAMQAAFALSLVRGSQSGAPTSFDAKDLLGFWLFTLSGLGLVGAFLLGGAAGVPRRWAQHFVEWLMYDRVGTVCAVGVVLATAGLLLPTILRLLRPKLARTG